MVKDEKSRQVDRRRKKVKVKLKSPDKGTDVEERLRDQNLEKETYHTQQNDKETQITYVEELKGKEETDNKERRKQTNIQMQKNDKERQIDRCRRTIKRDKQTDVDEQ